MYVYKDAFATVGEQWFRSSAEGAGEVDAVIFRQSPEPRAGVVCEPFATRVIDLRKSQDEIWSGVHKKNRQLIRRATEKDHFICEFFGPAEIGSSLIDRFADFYDRFAAHKNLARLRRTKFTCYAQGGGLYLAHVHLPGGDPLCWHSFILSDGQARVLHSASVWEEETDPEHGAMMGRANRLLYWRGIVEFRNLGAKVYDFGGWYLGGSDREKLAINYFKGQFGGDIVNSFDFAVARSFKGWAYLGLRSAYLAYTNLKKSRHAGPG